MDQQQIFADMALKAWQQQIEKTTKILDKLTDEGLLREIAPGRNRAIYVIGHLIAVNDTMISLFGLGERQYAQFDEPFVKQPDNPATSMPDASGIREAWKKSTELLATAFSKLTPAEWFQKHTAMSDEDLAKEPTRNKLSVLINRTNHLSYHRGQLIWAGK